MNSPSSVRLTFKQIQLVGQIRQNRAWWILNVDRVLGSAEEGLDTQMLLDPLEEQFHLPAAAIKLGDRERRQRANAMRMP
jgi:hypothetical protein